MPQHTLLAGTSFKHEHRAAILADVVEDGLFFEVHAENYMGAGGPPHRAIAAIRDAYPISIHGVCMSIGANEPLNGAHLVRFRELVARYEPMLVSEHLAWSTHAGTFYNDLLPLPYTEEALNHMVSRVGQVQDALGRQMLIENVSSYLQFAHSQIDEWDFLAELARRSGCGLLLDVNNVYVSAMNHGFDAFHYLTRIPRQSVREMHLAGHSTHVVGEREIRIDTHSAPVCDAVWALYSAALERFGPVPTLIEWDADIPALDVLVAEAHKADRLMEARHASAA